ncbi:uncharacterized protein LOC124495620 [Dermatophagoides farinae]|uniref:uncharacterized protein LOC124495620 n=1 Tax=Dermatophagoides farinae TaxID=6954 RepID=UPI003F63D5A3
MSDLLTTMPSSTDLNESSLNNSEDKKDSILQLFQYDLDRHRMREVWDMFNRVVVTEIHNNGSYIVWDLVPIICQRLRGLSEFRFKTFSMCRQILLDLCEICNPKELLIIYLSELENDLNITRYSKRKDPNQEQPSSSSTAVNDENDDDVEDIEITDSNCFKALLKPFEVILLKLPKKRNETLKSVLSSLNEHISRLSLSSITKYNPETDDRFKLMLDPVVNNLNSVLSMYVDFLETFVKEVDLYNPTTSHHHHQMLNNIHSKTSDPNIQRITLLKTLLLMLEYPLKYMDLYRVNGKESIIQGIKQAGTNLSALFNEDFITSRMIAVKIVRLISSLHSNFYTLLSRTDLITSPEDVESNSDCSDVYLSQTNFQSAMSILSYLLATESELSPSNFMPRVYTHVYNLGIYLPYIQNLVEDQQFFVYEKGLHLLAAMLAHIKEESLEANFLDLLRQHPIEKSLTSIMVFALDKHSRTTALLLFKQLVNCFEPSGRYKILYSILSQSRQHAGFQGVAIQMYKDFVFEHQVYQGSNLHRMIRSVIAVALPQDANSDLLERNDLIFGLLNFLRYIMIRDTRHQNHTRIWDVAIVIQENFLKPLQEALELSRISCKLELCKLKDMKLKMNKNDHQQQLVGKGNKKKKGQNHHSSKIDQSVVIYPNEKPIQWPEMTIEQEHKQIMFALQNFDLIESIHTRLKEIIDEQQQQQPQ